MAYILHDPTIFDIQYIRTIKRRRVEAIDIYRLSVSNDVFRGNFPIVRWAISKGVIDPLIMIDVASVGNIECLEYLHKKGCQWNKETSMAAVEYGQLDCLRYMCEEGCPLSRYICSQTARYSQLDCLTYLHVN